MKELVQLQKDINKLTKKVKELDTRLTGIESKVGQDVVAMRAEAKAVLEKCTALVNPYSPNTITYDKPGGTI